MKFAYLAIVGLSVAIPVLASDDLDRQGWQSESPRDEISPDFSWRVGDGPSGNAALAITADSRQGLAGDWFKEVTVEGGQHYRFLVQRKCAGIDLPRRAAIARIIWLDESGGRVNRQQPSAASYRPGEPPRRTRVSCGRTDPGRMD